MSATPPGTTLPARGRVAYAVVHQDPPDVYIAENEFVLTWLLAVHVVAHTDPKGMPVGCVERMRRALLDENWSDAVAEWITATGITIDAYPDETIWMERHLDEERATLEVRVARIFGDTNAS